MNENDSNSNILIYLCEIEVRSKRTLLKQRNKERKKKKIEMRGAQVWANGTYYVVIQTV